jgi:Spy/CpxP family protein refolding chaperone
MRRVRGARLRGSAVPEYIAAPLPFFTRSSGRLSLRSTSIGAEVKKIMNRWIRRGATFASLVGSLALVAGGIAYAHDTQGSATGQGRKEHREGHRAGLLGAALKLDSITPEQRASIEQLIQQRLTASTPVRQADAQVLTVLAQQVEQAQIDPAGLAPTLGAEQTAAEAENAVDRDTLNRLHSILSPAQRGQLVDRLEAGRTKHDHARERADGGARFGWGLDLTPEQRSQIRANLGASAPANGAPQASRTNLLEAFRGDSFDASTFVSVRNPGTRMERLAQAMVPVLSPSQRATFANHLRTKAQHESSAKHS